jgi:hypothetical protein
MAADYDPGRASGASEGQVADSKKVVKQPLAMGKGVRIQL